MSESEEPKLIEWDTMEVSPYRYSKRNWMKGVEANRNAVKTYQEIEPVRVPGEKVNRKYPGLCVRYRGKVV